MLNLAISYHEADRHDEALKLKRESARHFDADMLGPEHPGTIRAMSNLANSLHTAGRQPGGT